MLSPGSRVAAGISGGADSVCLLFVLLEWKKRFGLELAAVHVDHGIREESGEDARFTGELCERLGVVCYQKKVDVRGYAARNKCSEEEAGRILRYEAFEEAAKEFGADKIAVAHNLNDRSETMLFQLFRGSGLKGLAGIPPVRGNIIRPLLCLERREIEQYLREIGQDYCTDATNEKDDYTRNRIRHHILPYAEKEISANCVRHMGNAADLLAETENYMEQQTEEALRRCARDFSGLAAPEYRLDIRAFTECHPALQKRMLYTLIRSLSPGAKDISHTHVEDALTLFGAESNRSISLPFGIVARREYGEVVLERGQKDGQDRSVSEEFSVQYSVLQADELPKDDKKSLIFPQNQYTKWFDYDKIERRPVLRTRRSGDYLTIADGQGGMHRKSLQDYMVTEKIPKQKRDSIPVLAVDSHVLWLAGYRISEYYKITENTKRILQVQLIAECKTEDKNGRTC